MKSSTAQATQDGLIRALEDAISSLRAAKATAAKVYGVRLPVEPEIKRIKRYVVLAKRGDPEALSHRPASAKRLRAARKNGMLAAGVPKGESSKQNLQRWRDSQDGLVG